MSMSIPHRPSPKIPADPNSAIREVFNLKQLYILIGDQTGALSEDMDYSQLFVLDEVSTELVPRLALITLFQFAETMTDHQAAEAVCTRMDWKYALHLPLNYPGFDEQVLCRFRCAVLHSPGGMQTFQTLISRLAELGLLGGKKNRPADAATVICRVCTLSRLEWMMNALAGALEVLAVSHSGLLREIAPPYWYAQYDRGHFPCPAPVDPREQVERAAMLGKDTFYLLARLETRKEVELEALPELRLLQQIAADQYEQRSGKLYWRLLRCASCQ